MSGKVWEGTWNTTYGELRLRQRGNKVFGDYKHIGLIEGTYNAITGVVEGIFVNGRKEGRIKFIINGNRFDGKWSWGNIEPQDTNGWNGTKTSSQTPTLTSHPWEGTWGMSHGDLKLIQEGKQVYGGYKNRLTLEGEYTFATKTLSGIFTTNGRKGRFEFVLKDDGKSFEGKWSWGTAEPSAEWNGTKKSDSTPVTPDKPSEDSSKISGSKLDVVPGGRDNVSEKNERSNGEEETPAGYVCVSKKYTVDASFNENYLLSTTQSEVYPGNIISARSFANGSITPVNGRRNAYTISDSIAGKNARVNQASISSVRSAIQSILPYQTTTPASVIYESRIINSQEDLRVHLKAGYDNGIHKIQASGGYKSTTKKNVVAVKFIQLYYTIDIDKPAVLNSSAFFSDNTNLTNDMLVVSQVGYGRQLIFLAETNFSQTEIEAAIKYAGQTGSGKVDVEAEAKHKKVIENSRINVYAVGGAASDTIQVINDGLEGIKRYLKAGANFSKNSPGVPIFYKLKFLQSWDDANVRFSTEITKTECTQTRGKFRFSFDWMVCYEEDDGPFGGGKEDLYGIGWCRLFVNPKRGGQKRQVMPENFRYLDRYGRVYSLLPKDARSVRKGDGFQIGPELIFDIDARHYGYENFDELKHNAYFDITFEAKEEDLGDDFILPEENARVYLNNANIEKLPKEYVVAARNKNQPGILKAQRGNTRVGISFSIEPLVG